MKNIPNNASKVTAVRPSLHPSVPARSAKGFTLIELLIVIAIIGFLAAAILVAVDPVKRIQDSRDSQRWSEVNSILNAVLKHQVDNRALFNGGDNGDPTVNGNPIISHDTNAQLIINNFGDDTAANPVTCTALAGAAWATYCPGADALGLTVNATGNNCMADLGLLANTDLSPSTYLAQIPVDPAVGDEPGDPTAGTPYETGYFIHRNSGNRITIGACEPEQAANISVRR